jgi:hypothetical protein
MAKISAAALLLVSMSIAISSLSSADLDSIKQETATGTFPNVTSALINPTDGVVTPTISNTETYVAYFQSIVIFIGILGTLANGFVLFILLYHRPSSGTTTNVFICNQTILDLIACVNMVLVIAIRLAKVYKTVTSWKMVPLHVCH